MMKKKVPFDAAAVQKTGERVAALAPMIPDAFATDTHKATNVKTKAREGIWTNAADFKAKSEDLAKAALALAAAARTGDQGATMKAAFGVGKACSACHDNYKDSK
jgi:cytochrome c556